MLTVVATEEEIKLIEKGSKYIVTGVGAVNVFNALKDVDRDEMIYNIGYAGSNIIPIGSKVRIGKVCNYHPNANFTEPEYDLGGDVICYSSTDFVLKTEIKEPCVFDMELVYILAMGFENVVSDKIISDNLDLNEYNDMVYGDLNGKTEN